MKNHSLTHHSNAGFSLLEMLAIIIIIGLLGALAAPGWISFMNRQRAISAKDQVQQAIRITQAEAKRLRRVRTVELFPSASATAGVPEVSVNGVRQTLGRGEFEPGTIELTAVDDDAATVTELVFQSDGSLSVDDADYTTAPPTLPVTITVAAPPGSGNKRCLKIETILVSINSESDAACD